MNRKSAAEIILSGDFRKWNSHRSSLPTWNPDLSGVGFGSANLIPFDLRRANLCGANVSKAQLVSFFFNCRLDGAIYNSLTLWPKGFKAREHGAVERGIGDMKVDPKKVFVVHGRNERARNAIFQFIRSLGLEPIEWSQAIRLTGKPSPFIGEVIDVALAQARAILVLMTPDDIAYLRESLRNDTDPAYEREPTPQPRPNVLFEAGVAMGRSADRTILIQLGKIRPFSDIAGRHLVFLNNSPERRQDLADRLLLAGCPADISNRDWQTTGDFDAAVQDL